MGQSRPLFVYFCSFLITISIQIEKNVDCVLGIRTQGRRMVGADETKELCGHPALFLCIIICSLLSQLWMHQFVTACFRDRAFVHNGARSDESRVGLRRRQLCAQAAPDWRQWRETRRSRRGQLQSRRRSVCSWWREDEVDRACESPFIYPSQTKWVSERSSLTQVVLWKV